MLIRRHTYVCVIKSGSTCPNYSKVWPWRTWNLMSKHHTSDGLSIMSPRQVYLLYAQVFSKVTTPQSRALYLTYHNNRLILFGLDSIRRTWDHDWPWKETRMWHYIVPRSALEDQIRSDALPYLCQRDWFYTNSLIFDNLFELFNTSICHDKDHNLRKILISKINFWRLIFHKNL